MTEDMMWEQQNILSRLGTSQQAAKVRAKMQTTSLLSDMQAFKVSEAGVAEVCACVYMCVCVYRAHMCRKCTLCKVAWRVPLLFCLIMERCCEIVYGICT